LLNRLSGTGLDRMRADPFFFEETAQAEAAIEAEPISNKRRSGKKSAK
jgi:hypothetical protein